MKNFLRSKTLWGVALMAIGAAFPKLGLTEETSGALVQYCFEAVGAILAVIGRFTAKKDLTIGPSA